MHMTSRAPVLSATSSRDSVWIMVYLSQLNPPAPPWFSRSVLVPSAAPLLLPGCVAAWVGTAATATKPPSQSSDSFGASWRPSASLPLRPQRIPQRGKTEIISNNLGLASAIYRNFNNFCCAITLDDTRCFDQAGHGPGFRLRDRTRFLDFDEVALVVHVRIVMRVVLLRA